MAQLDLAPFKSRKRCSVPALPELEQADTAGEDRDLVSRRSTFSLREVRSATNHYLSYNIYNWRCVCIYISPTLCRCLNTK